MTTAPIARIGGRGSSAPFGYLMVHFVEDPHGYAEKIYLSLSRGEDPASWYRLNDGEPILASTVGTTGVRDPHLVRSPDRFYLVATDLRVFGGDDAGWAEWSRRGSRSIVIWETADLLTWSPPRLAEVAPANAGMAWAPESIHDNERDEYVVFWSSNLFPEDDPDHNGPTYSRILYATTRDFVTFGPARVYLDTASSTIDTTMIRHDGKVFRFHKDNGPSGRLLYADVVSSLFAGDAVVLQEHIGRPPTGDVEGPLVFKDNYADRWFLLADHFGPGGIGYRPLVTTNPEAGDWSAFDGAFELPVDTKHGVVLPLQGPEWERLSGVAATAVEPPSVTTTVGQEPRLPDRVTVHLTDASTQQRPVAWSPPDPAAWSGPGTVAVPGAVAGTDLTASAVVTIGR